VLNKVDRLKPGHIATQMKTASTLGDFHALHPVAAKTGEGIDELRDDLISLLPEGPFYFPPDTDTDMPLEARIAELVREQARRSPARRCRTLSRRSWWRSTTSACTSVSTPRPRVRSRS
jgi:GTP-binding protein Era